MKILFISPFFYPHSGGAEKYAEELFSKLIIDHPDIEVDIICYNTNEAPETEAYKGMKIYRVTAFNLLKQQFYLPNLFDLIKRLRLLKNNKYDYVGTQTRFFDATWWTWIYARYVHAESFFIGHGTGFVSHSSALVRAIAKIVDLSIAKLALKMYSKVIVISKSTQDFFENVLGVKDTQL
ncbi:glycosyltransferase, partial [candidate division WWE3 bacterium]|nr:glycosyltransferase [candidate division WWE3 bacterium]